MAKHALVKGRYETGNRSHQAVQPKLAKEHIMDFVYIPVIVGFFAVSAGLIRFCAGLMDKGGKS
jgi:hypothetical protein